MKLLYISPVPYDGAGCRFRIYQYIPYLSKRGLKCSVSPFLFKSFFKIVYKKGKILPKILFFTLSFLRRLVDLIRAFNCDAVIVYRESFPLGPPVFEYILHLFGKKIVFDFDDAIFFPSTSETNRIIARLRCSNNAGKIIKISKAVIAGNNYLRDYALKFNSNVRVIPTVVDTEKFRPATKRNDGKLIIGWTGTSSTQRYVLPLKDAFSLLLRKYPDIEIRIIGDQENIFGFDNIVYKKWSLKEEILDIQNFTIGIMPLPDTEWARGKCGFKIVQYMSCGIPAVASNIGTNKKIIQDGVNGFLASTQEQWIAKLSILIENPDLCKRMGLEGRKFIEEKYSLKKYGQRYAKNILEILNEN